MISVCFFCCHGTNLWEYQAATNNNNKMWGAETILLNLVFLCYVHLEPSLPETGKPLSLATWPLALVILVATMGGGGLVGSFWC